MARWVVSLVLLWLGCLGCEEKSAFSRHYGRPFRSVLIRTGNSVEGYQRAEKAGISYAESDFELSKDGIVVSAHDDRLSGNCGVASHKTLKELRQCALKKNEHVATLKQFLALPLKEWFIDLKASDTKNDEVLLRAVRAAVADIQVAGKGDKAVLMLYRVTPAVVELIHDEHIRAGMKGYPKSTADVIPMVEEASRHGFEMVCVEAKYLDADVLRMSAKKQVWHLGWTRKPSPSKWRGLVQAGLGGLISRRPEKLQQLAPVFVAVPAR